MARTKTWSNDVWKLIALIALSASVIMACVGIYAVLAFKSNIDVISKSAPVCMAGMHEFDSIAAAQAIGRLDLVSFLLTTGGILLGLFSMIGFWVIRREAMEEARDAALEEVRRILPLFGLDENGQRTQMRDSGRPKIRVKARRERKKSRPSQPSPLDVPTAGAIRETPGESDDDTEGGA